MYNFHKINKGCLDKQSKAIEVLRFPLMVLVIFSHMLPFKQEPLKMSLDVWNIYHVISELISHHIARLSVCFFFTISGYYFFVNQKSWDTLNYISKLRKKYKSLIIPYFIWNFIIIIAVLFKNVLFKGFGFSYDDNYIPIQDLSLYDIFWKTPANFPLWFVRDLIVMNLIAPLFYILFKYTKYWGLIVLFILYVGVIELPVPGFSSISIFYFGLGAYIGCCKLSILSIAIRFRKPAFIFAFIFLCISLYTMGGAEYEHWKRFYLLFGVLVLFYIGKLLSNTRLNNFFIFLAPTTFFIYVVHEVYILNWLKGLLSRSYFTTSGWTMLIGYFVTPFLCVLIILLLYRFFNRYMPQFFNVIIGNRNSSLKRYP